MKIRLINDTIVLVLLLLCKFLCKFSVGGYVRVITICKILKESTEQVNKKEINLSEYNAIINQVTIQYRIYLKDYKNER